MNQYVEYGQSLYDKGLLQDAEDAFNNALALESSRAQAYQGLGVVYFAKNEFDKSINFSMKAVDLCGSDEQARASECFCNMAMAFKAKKDIANALFCYENAILLNINNYDAYFGISVTYLLNKDFENGFKLYRSRFFKNEPVLAHFFEDEKEWTGENIKNKKLYVYHEQGFGDNIQFVRYFKSFPKNVQILFKTRPELEKLFEENDLRVSIIKNNVVDSEIEFDAYTHLLSIPQLLKATSENIPLSGGYLMPNKNKVEKYKNKYFNNKKFKLGIVWRGTPDAHIDKVISLDKFLKFLNIPNVEVYSLQVNLVENENQELAKYNIQDLGKTFKDFSDTAAAIENLDLLISVDTAVVHLAGAMNKPVWVLLSYIPEWRWFLDSEKSPWYDSAKLYRQDESRNWDNVFKQVLKNLEARVLYYLTTSGNVFKL